MNKKLFSTKLDNIATYNEFVITPTIQNIESISFNDSIFNIFSKQTIITIEKSGSYTFKNQTNSNKNIKIIINPGIDVELIEINTSNEQHSINQIGLEISDNSCCTYYLIDNLNILYNNREASLEKNSSLNFKILSLNGSLSQNKFIINLNGQYSRCDFQCVSVASNENENSYDVTINNNAKDTHANIWQKGVSSNFGKINFEATGSIKNDCDRATNFQESRILLLDDASLGNASPILLIDHFDVEAGHAASVSRVNDDELFYLQSRGIDTKQAEQLMTHAFINPLFDSISNEEIKELFLNTINAGLENA